MEQGGISEPGDGTPTVGGRDLRRMSIIAACASAPLVLIHVAMAVLVTPVFADMYANMGGELPLVFALVMAGSQNGLLVLMLLLLDAVVFAVMYILARRYTAGLVFVPIPVYVVMIGLFVIALYMPMFAVISFVE